MLARVSFVYQGNKEWWIIFEKTSRVKAMKSGLLYVLIMMTVRLKSFLGQAMQL